jgi:uncharacterized protein (DUF2147 family)
MLCGAVEAGKGAGLDRIEHAGAQEDLAGPWSTQAGQVCVWKECAQSLERGRYQERVPEVIRPDEQEA